MELVMKKILYSSLFCIALMSSYSAQALIGEVFEGVGETTKAAGRTVDKANPLSKEKRNKKTKQQNKSNKTKKSRKKQVKEEVDEIL